MAFHRNHFTGSRLQAPAPHRMGALFVPISADAAGLPCWPRCRRIVALELQSAADGIEPLRARATRSAETSWPLLDTKAWAGRNAQTPYRLSTPA